MLDASATVEWLLQTPTGMRVGSRVLARREDLHAPHLLTVEVAQVLRRYVAKRQLTPGRAQEALRDLLDLPLNCYPHDALLWRVWALRNSLSAYDAVYVALAEALPARLVTCDSKLASAGGHHARIELV